MTHPHLIAAEMRFDDGFVARREMVAGGAVSDSINSELTPVVLMGKLTRDARIVLRWTAVCR